MDWIDSYKAEKGEMPPVPDWLVGSVTGYGEGPISEGVRVRTPSGQLWGRMSEADRQVWRELVEHQKQDAEGLLRHMRQMLPRNPRGK